MSYKPKFLGHVNMYVRDLECSRQWYQDLLGLHTYDYKEGRAAFLSADLEQSHEIALMEVPATAPDNQPGQVGLNHMAWMYESLEDLKEAYHRVKELNIPIEHISNHGVSIGIYLRDPDGNGVELSYELPRNQWYRQENVFLGERRQDGNFPGPWDEEIAARKQAAATK